MLRYLYNPQRIVLGVNPLRPRRLLVEHTDGFDSFYCSIDSSYAAIEYSYGWGLVWIPAAFLGRRRDVWVCVNPDGSLTYDFRIIAESDIDSGCSLR